MGARTLFTTMPRAGEPAYDGPDREKLKIIHDGGERGGFSLLITDLITFVFFYRLCIALILFDFAIHQRVFFCVR